MLELLTSGSIISTIVMQEPPPALVLLVEGPDDDSLLGGHLAAGVVGITCGGRSTVIESVKIAQDNHWNHVFGLVDRDIKPETIGVETLPEGVVVTDTYDLTADVAAAKPGAISQAVIAHAHREARVVSSARRENVETAVLDLATRFAGIRISVMRERYPIVLEGFDFRRALDHDFATADASIFIDALRKRDPHFRFTREQREEIEAQMLASAGQRPLAGGHDIAGAAIGIITLAGAKQIARLSIERTIRAFADCDLLSRLTCVRRLQELAIQRTSRPMFDCLSAAA